MMNAVTHHFLIVQTIPKKVSKRYKLDSAQPGSTSASGSPQSYPQKLWLVQNDTDAPGETDPESPAAG
jgi:hypothetical protein